MQAGGRDEQHQVKGLVIDSRARFDLSFESSMILIF
jgi:hypothetical protein